MSKIKEILQKKGPVFNVVTPDTKVVDALTIMKTENLRVNNEFYVCPVFNEAIQDCKQIRTFSTKAMWGLGTPEDLKHYLENYK